MGTPRPFFGAPQLGTGLMAISTPGWYLFMAPDAASMPRPITPPNTMLPAVMISVSDASTPHPRC